MVDEIEKKIKEKFGIGVVVIDDFLNDGVLFVFVDF